MTQADAGKGVTPMFTTTERNKIHGHEYDMQWVRVKTPSKTIKTLKQPLPVDRTYDVDGELDSIYKQPYKYDLIFNDYPEGNYTEVMPNNLRWFFTHANPDNIDFRWEQKGEDYDHLIISSDYYQKLKKKFITKDDQNYFKSKYVRPIYPTKNHVNKNIQLKIN